MLEYGNTPVSRLKYAPAQLAMSRWLRSKLPTTKAALKPRVINAQPDLQARQVRFKQDYDRNAKSVSPLKTGDVVRVQRKWGWDRAVVQRHHDSPRSSVVQHESGVVRRRTAPSRQSSILCGTTREWCGQTSYSATTTVLDPLWYNTRVVWSDVVQRHHDSPRSSVVQHESGVVRRRTAPPRQSSILCGTTREWCAQTSYSATTTVLDPLWYNTRVVWSDVVQRHHDSPRSSVVQHESGVVRRRTAPPRQSSILCGTTREWCGQTSYSAITTVLDPLWYNTRVVWSDVVQRHHDSPRSSVVQHESGVVRRRTAPSRQSSILCGTTREWCGQTSYSATTTVLDPLWYNTRVVWSDVVQRHHDSPRSSVVQHESGVVRRRTAPPRQSSILCGTTREWCGQTSYSAITTVLDPLWYNTRVVWSDVVQRHHDSPRSSVVQHESGVVRRRTAPPRQSSILCGTTREWCGQTSYSATTTVLDPLWYNTRVVCSGITAATQ